MRADLFFSNVEFFGAPTGQRVRVKVGEAFRMELKEAPEGVNFATTADPVLKLDDNGTTAVILAEAVGNSEVQIQQDRNVVMYVSIEVYSPTEATSLGIAAGSPEPK